MNRKIVVLISVIVAFIILAGVVLINLSSSRPPTNSNQQAQTNLNSDISNILDSTEEIENNLEQIPDSIENNINPQTPGSGVPLNLEKVNDYQKFEIKSLSQNKGLLEVDKSYFQNDAFFGLLQATSILSPTSDFLSQNKAYFVISYEDQSILFLGYDIIISEKINIRDKNYWLFSLYGTLGNLYTFLFDENIDSMLEILTPKLDVVNTVSFKAPNTLEITYSNANSDESNFTEVYNIVDLFDSTVLEFQNTGLETAFVDVQDFYQENLLTSISPSDPQINYGDAQDSISLQQ